jgi:hypothetical protein
MKAMTTDQFIAFLLICAAVGVYLGHRQLAAAEPAAPATSEIFSKADDDKTCKDQGETPYTDAYITCRTTLLRMDLIAARLNQEKEARERQSP